MTGILGRARTRAGVLVLSLLMVAVGAVGWGLALAAGARMPANSALVDKAATATVQAEVSRSLTAVLSYDYTDPTSMQAAADRVLTGAARSQHATLFRALEKRADHQKLILDAQVSAASVIDLTSTRATLLVFVDQSSRRASDKAASVSAAQLLVQASKLGGHWLISSLKPL